MMNTLLNAQIMIEISKPSWFLWKIAEVIMILKPTRHQVIKNLAFDKIWYRGTEYKLHRDLSEEIYQSLSFLGRMLQTDNFVLSVETSTQNWRVFLRVFRKAVCCNLSCIYCTRRICLIVGKIPWGAVGNEVEAAANKLQSSIAEVYAWT